MKKAAALLILTAFSYLSHAKSKDMSNIQEEIWKDVIGYEGLYQVSSLGQVKSFKYDKINGRILSPKPDSKRRRKYIRAVMPGGKKVFIHCLVGDAFFGPCDDPRMVMDHINNDPSDNRLVNLQRISVRENNTKNCKRKSKYIGVSWSKRGQYWWSQITFQGKRFNLGQGTEKECRDKYIRAVEAIRLAELQNTSSNLYKDFQKSKQQNNG